MTPAEAKKILLLRRGPADDADPEIAEALAVAQNDPALREWLHTQERFQKVVKDAFREMNVPTSLKGRILAQAPIELRPSRRRFSMGSAITAAAAIIIGLFIVLHDWHGNDDSFAIFRSRMVRSVLRQYQMDILTNNMAVIRQFLSTNQAPADYVLPTGLNQLAPLGAGLQSWQHQRVSMVCLNSGAKGTAILFVVDADGVKSPPPPAPVFEQVSKLMTASWTTAGRAYLLMIDNKTVDQATLKQYL